MIDVQNKPKGPNHFLKNIKKKQFNTNKKILIGKENTP